MTFWIHEDVHSDFIQQARDESFFWMGGMIGNGRALAATRQPLRRRQRGVACGLRARRIVLRLIVPIEPSRTTGAEESASPGEQCAVHNRHPDRRLGMSGSVAAGRGRGLRSGRPWRDLRKQDLIGEDLEQIAPRGNDKHGRDFAHLGEEANARAGYFQRLVPQLLG